jgi:hypothetical protein
MVINSHGRIFTAMEGIYYCTFLKITINNNNNNNNNADDDVKFVDLKSVRYLLHGSVLPEFDQYLVFIPL